MASDNRAGTSPEVVSAPGGAETVPQPRLKAIDRQQLRLHPVEVDRLVEDDHPVRAIWELVGQMPLEPFYAAIKAVDGVGGRDATDPQLLISLWVWAYSDGVSSAHEIERRMGYHPAYQWLAGLQVINYHTLADFRTQHQTALHGLFVDVLGVLEHAGVVTLERVMHDGTKVKAHAADKSFRRDATLTAHVEAARQHVEQLEREAAESPELPPRRRQAQVRAAREKQQRVAQALEELQQIRAHSGHPVDARASETDPEARIMQLPHGAYGPGYNVQLSTDAQAKIIVSTGISQCSSDAGELAPALDRVAANLGRPPREMVVDAGFTTQATIEEMADREIALVGSLPDPTGRVEVALKSCGVAPEFFPSAFGYDAARNAYTCPAGKRVAYQEREKEGSTIRYRYRAAQADCATCPFKARCCPHTPMGRVITRVEDSPALAAFTAKMQTPEAQQIYKQRAGVAEFPNAWLKEKLGLRQFRLRGLVKVSLEVVWACLTYNIQQWIRLLWRPQRQAAPVAAA